MMTISAARSVSWAVFVVACASGCGAKTPLPNKSSHPADEAYVAADRQPETVRVQMLDAAPDDDSVWIDGYWNWAGWRWVWREGRWEKPVAGGHYAEAEYEMKKVATGGTTAESIEDDTRQTPKTRIELQFRPGHWHDADGGIADAEGVVAREVVAQDAGPDAGLGR